MSNVQRVFESKHSTIIPFSFQGREPSLALKSLPKDFELTPDWGNSLVTQVNGKNYIEVPLSGEIYNTAIVHVYKMIDDSIGNYEAETRMLGVKNVLLIKESPQLEHASYQILSIVANPHDVDRIQFLDSTIMCTNSTLIFSDLEGQYVQSFNVVDRKRHPVRYTSQFKNTESSEFASLSLKYIPEGDMSLRLYFLRKCYI